MNVPSAVRERSLRRYRALRQDLDRRIRRSHQRRPVSIRSDRESGGMGRSATGYVHVRRHL